MTRVGSAECGDVESALAASLLPALAVSAALALSLTASLALLSAGTASDLDAAGSVRRYLDNSFCLTILGIGLWALIYAALQIWSVAIDFRTVVKQRDHMPGAVLRWLLAPVAQETVLERSAEPSLRAHLAADRWDTVSTMRAAPMGFAIWTLPLLGFIGTVIGISTAIGDLGAVFGQTGREEALAQVLASLRFAFDTTFIGLALVIPNMALTTFFRGRLSAARHAIVRAASEAS